MHMPLHIYAHAHSVHELCLYQYVHLAIYINVAGSAVLFPVVIISLGKVNIAAVCMYNRSQRRIGYLKRNASIKTAVKLQLNHKTLFYAVLGIYTQMTSMKVLGMKRFQLVEMVTWHWHMYAMWQSLHNNLKKVKNAFFVMLWLMLLVIRTKSEWYLRKG